MPSPRTLPTPSSDSSAAEFLEQPRAALRSPIDQSLAFEDLDVLQGDGTARRVAGVGERVHPALARRHAVDRLAHPVGHADAAQRDVAAGDALRELDDVGLDT